MAKGEWWSINSAICQAALYSEGQLRRFEEVGGLQNAVTHFCEDMLFSASSLNTPNVQKKTMLYKTNKFWVKGIPNKSISQDKNK